MIAKVLDAASDVLAKDRRTESDSTQDMLATIEERINNNENIEDLVFFSTDVKSLYPSLEVEPCAAIVARMLQESRLQVEGVNWDQAVLYLALTLERAKITELGLDTIRDTGSRCSNQEWRITIRFWRWKEVVAAL